MCDLFREIHFRRESRKLKTCRKIGPARSSSVIAKTTTHERWYLRLQQLNCIILYNTVERSFLRLFHIAIVHCHIRFFLFGLLSLSLLSLHFTLAISLHMQFDVCDIVCTRVTCFIVVWQFPYYTQSFWIIYYLVDVCEYPRRTSRLEWRSSSNTSSGYAFTRTDCHTNGKLCDTWIEYI